MKTTYGRLHPAFSGGMKLGTKTRKTAFSVPSGSRIPSSAKGK